MSESSQRESMLLGAVVGAIVGIGLVVAVGLLVDFNTADGPSTAAASSPTTTLAVQAGDTSGAGQGQGQGVGQGLGQGGQGQGAGNGQGGGPPPGRGPQSHEEDDLGDPLSYGTASAEVLAAFEVGGCVACHPIKGVGGGAATLAPGMGRIGVTGANRVPGISAEAYIEQSILDPTAFVRPNCPTGPCLEIMPTTYSETLTADQLATIVNYLAALGTAAEADVLTPPTG